jgi:hypothetical protein
MLAFHCASPTIETKGQADKVVPFGQIAGLDVTSAPLAGVMRADNLDEKSRIVVRRQLEKDALQLVTIECAMAPGCVQACSPWHVGRPGRESSGQPLRDFNPFAASPSGRRSGALCGRGCAFPGSAHPIASRYAAANRPSSPPVKGPPRVVGRKAQIAPPARAILGSPAGTPSPGMRFPEKSESAKRAAWT